MHEPATDTEDEDALVIANADANAQALKLLRPALRETANMHALPETAHDLIEIIGLQATVDLVGRWGGTELRVPAQRDASRTWTELVEDIGELAAGKLVDSRFSGTPVYVPTCTAALRGERDRLIVKMLREGEGVEAARRQFRMTKSAIYRIFRRANAS